MGGCGPLENRGGLPDVLEAEEDQRRIRSWLQTAICVIDIDVRFPQRDASLAISPGRC